MKCQRAHCTRAAVTRRDNELLCDHHAAPAGDSSPKCEALKGNPDDNHRCSMPGRHAVNYRQAQLRSLCSTHYRQWFGWGTHDQDQMAQVLWHWPTVQEMDDARAPRLV